MNRFDDRITAPHTRFSSSPIIGCFLLNDTAMAPTYGTSSSACFDLYANITGEAVKGWNTNNDKFFLHTKDGVVDFPPNTRMLIPTGVIFDIPEGYSLRLHPRSSTALKQGLTLVNCEGVIDEDYTHETFLALVNTSSEIIKVSNGDRLAQGELVKDTRAMVYNVEEAPSSTTRNGGFGSTGK